ncbi:trafficking protein particle complex subunit 9 [Mycolicibacterium fortuitum subsp. acetamidolyticum]|uniref:Trafficking protein particle complex subunit 9 n=1 Tax=Mycolicibacterium fortuitum subsp. acetamidolyticum TaxID=144550 RepID=A0A117IDM1_MYCFO|nr:trafficking protein particle complex subunit 9 [Mycolicibacterium fortuitum subsp. acetamidolyticum]
MAVHAALGWQYGLRSLMGGPLDSVDANRNNPIGREMVAQPGIISVFGISFYRCRAYKRPF